MTTGEIVTSIRESRGILQKDLAKAIDVDPVVLNRIEKDKRPIRGNELKAIADYFNVSTDYLLGRNVLGHRVNLSNEQKNLLNGFNGLNDESKKTIMYLIKQLSFSSPSAGSANVIQNNKTGNNFMTVSGNQYINSAAI